MMPDWSLPFPMEAFILPRVSHRDISNPSASKRIGRLAADINKPAATSAEICADDDRTLCQYLEGIASGSEGALGDLYDATVNRVYGVALRIVRHADLAEEVVSDVFMQVWRDANRYDDSRGRVMGWLLIIARSRALDLLRKQDEAFSHPDPHELAEEPCAARDNPQDILAASRSHRTLHAALEKLSPLQRQLLSLAFFRGLTHSEIVDHTGIPLGSVKTHIRRSLAILRESLGPEIEFTI